jgi:hypothetical protein
MYNTYHISDYAVNKLTPIVDNVEDKQLTIKQICGELKEGSWEQFVEAAQKKKQSS